MASLHLQKKKKIISKAIGTKKYKNWKFFELESL